MKKLIALSALAFSLSSLNSIAGDLDDILSGSDFDMPDCQIAMDDSGMPVLDDNGMPVLTGEDCPDLSDFPGAGTPPTDPMPPSGDDDLDCDISFDDDGNPVLTGDDCPDVPTMPTPSSNPDDLDCDISIDDEGNLMLTGEDCPELPDGTFGGGQADSCSFSIDDSGTLVTSGNCDDVEYCAQVNGVQMGNACDDMDSEE